MTQSIIINKSVPITNIVTDIENLLSELTNYISIQLTDENYPALTISGTPDTSQVDAATLGGKLPSYYDITLHNLNDLSDIKITNIADNDILKWDNTNSQWINTDLLTEILAIDGASSGIDADLLDGQEGSYYTDADNIIYDNTTSGLSAVNIQAAIDEVDSTVDTINTNLTNHINNTSNPHNVTAVQIGASNILTEIKKVDGAGSGLDADTVDGFDTSQTPAPNVIVPLNASGILDLSATYVKSNVYTFRRVDLTNATSDYMLQVGEEAIVSFNNIALVDFHIAVPEPASVSQPVVYEITIMILSGTAPNYDLCIFPNKTTYSGAFNVMRIGAGYGGSSWSVGITGNATSSNFFFDMQDGHRDTPPVTAILKATYWGKSNWKSMVGYGGDIGGLMLGFDVWKDTVTQWSSLGTFSFGGNNKNITGTAIVRRLA